MKKATATPTVELAALVHERSTVLAAGICHLDETLRSDSPFGAGAAIADDARTDGTNAVATRSEREAPGRPLLRPGTSRVAAALRRA